MVRRTVPYEKGDPPEAPTWAGLLTDRVDRLGDRITSAETAVAHIGDAVDALSRAVVAEAIEDEAAAPPPKLGPAPDWLRITDQDAAEHLLRDLGTWVHEVLRHHSTNGPIETCWPFHPGLVAVLLACQHAWRAAYEDPEARPAAGIEWSDRWLKVTTDRITATTTSCANGHADAVDPAQALTYARWWARTHGTPQDPVADPDPAVWPGKEWPPTPGRSRR